MDKDSLTVDVDVLYVICAGKKTRWIHHGLCLVTLVLSVLFISDYDRGIELSSPIWLRICTLGLIVTYIFNFTLARHMLKRIEESLDRLSK